MPTLDWGADGLLAVEVGGAAAPSAQTIYLTSDHLGSTRVVINETGQDVWRMDYTPFGLARSFSGGDPRANLAIYGANAPLKQQFTGQERGGERAGLYEGAVLSCLAGEVFESGWVVSGSECGGFGKLEFVWVCAE